MALFKFGIYKLDFVEVEKFIVDYTNCDFSIVVTTRDNKKFYFYNEDSAKFLNWFTAEMNR